jgi:hypothetical protein
MFAQNAHFSLENKGFSLGGAIAIWCFFARA